MKPAALRTFSFFLPVDEAPKFLVCLVKGTHTVYLSSSLYIKNQKPMIPRTHFHCITTWVARSSG